MESKVSNEEIINEILSKFPQMTPNAPTKNSDEYIENVSGSSKNIRSTTESPISKDFDSEDASSNDTPPEFIEDVDDERLQDAEEYMSDDEKEDTRQKALKLKEKGNTEFQSEKYIDSINTYTKALNLCPISYKEDRSIFYCNRAAAKIKLNYTETAIEDCAKAIELKPNYLKAYMRRARLYEAIDKYEDSLKDFTKVAELDPLNAEAKEALIRLPPMINEKNEKLKEEMLGKLKDLGNLILKPFGLSTENFKLQQDPNTGGYSVNFQQKDKC